ncbi:MAG: AAA family ATPase [Deltaproteobacteria bacterium]|nr:AAA family ATPase [Deltaproteobacteria bacterium]
MYEAFYNFKERPFNLTPDPKYLFLSERHREALAHLLYGIRQRSGFILLTGEVGTGKTTLCRALMHSLDADTEVALIFNPNVSSAELLQAINQEFGLPGASESRKALVDELNAHLLTRRQAGKNLVLLVDEAQNLPAPVLEELRLLSNLETETEKLLQIVLIGQPELNDLLGRTELRQLDQRMSVRYHLTPLDVKETGEYVAHRLSVASDKPRPRFTRGALRSLYRYSKGAPRLINTAADRALLVGFTRNRIRISGSIVRAAVQELRGRKRERGGWTRPIWGALAAASLALGAIVLWQPAREALLRVARAPEAEQGVGAGERPGERMVRIVTPTSMAVLPEAEIPGPLATPERTYESLLEDLSRTDQSQSWSAATNALLERWNAPMVSGAEVAYDLHLAAGEAGLRYASLPISLEELTRLDVPAIVALDLDEAGTRYVALLAYENDTFRTNCDPNLWIPISVLENARRGNVYLFWKAQEEIADVVKEGDQGPDVLWIKNALGESGYFEGTRDAYFDSSLTLAVSAFQTAYGIEPDGVVGDQTKMLLFSALQAYPTPRLSASP